MNDYIAKPVDERLLYSKIISQVKGASAPDKINKPEFNPPKSKCIDLSYLNRRTKSNPALMMEMISLYLNQTPRLVDAMNKSFLEEDWDSLHAAVHQMIPSFSIMGISHDFENMARTIQEYAGIQQQSDVIPALVLQLANICTQSCVELKEEYEMIKSLQI